MRIMKYTKILLAVAAVSALTISCSDEEYFDKEAYNKLIETAFPVENVDPNHDWKTVGTADASVTLMQSGEGQSTIRIYDGEPSNDTSRLLAKQSLSNGETMTTSLNYTLASPDVIIAVTDPDGFSSFYPRTIENGKLTTTVGNALTATKSRAGATRSTSTEGETYKFAEDYNGGVYPTDKNIENTIVVLADETYPISDASLNNKTIFVHEKGKLTANKEVTLNGTTIYNAGTMETGIVNLTNSSVVYNRGTWTTGSSSTTDADIKIDEESSATTSSQLVNDGSVFLNGNLILGGALLNVGSFEANHVDIKFTNDNTKQNAWVNEGYFKTTSYFQFNNGTKLSNQIINSCKLEVGGNLYFSQKGLTFCNNAGAYIHVTGTNNNNGITVDYNTDASLNLILGDQSFIKCDNVIKIYNTTISAPTGTDEFALIETKEFNGDSHSETTELKGRLYVGKETLSNKKNIIQKEGVFLGSFAEQGGHNVYIAQSNCSPGYTGTSKPTYPEKPAQYRYCYEDNYPQPGDYDFNDAVIDIMPEVGETNGQAKYTVALAAVGATKQIAAALRLKGIKKSDIKSLSISGDLYDNSTRQDVSRDILTSKFNGEDFIEGSDGDVVIYLFNDAHYALLQETSNTGDVYRPFINTIRQEDTEVTSIENNIEPATAEVTVNFNSAIANKATNVGTMDPFIVTEYNGARWEIHTIDWKNVPALFDYGRDDYNGVNLPWAICMDGYFKYPKEFTPIGNYSGGALGGAYQTGGHSFGEWCVDKNQATDWHNYPEDDKIYE